MAGLNYPEMYEAVGEQLDRLRDKRTGLETDLAETKAEIAHLEEMETHLRRLAGNSWGEDISGLGMTEAIRTLLRNAKTPLTAPELRKELVDKGFDLGGLSSPMASIYKILGRIVENSDFERNKNEQGQIVWAHKQPEITDDDIPF